jgi:hypothetical protein
MIVVVDFLCIFDTLSYSKKLKFVVYILYFILLLKKLNMVIIAFI